MQGFFRNLNIGRLSQAAEKGVVVGFVEAIASTLIAHPNIDMPIEEFIKLTLPNLKESIAFCCFTLVLWEFVCQCFTTPEARREQAYNAAVARGH